MIEDYLDLVDTITDEIEEVDDHVEDWTPQQIRRRIADLRHDMLHIRRTLSPTRDAIREVVDNRVDIETDTLFPHAVEVAFATAYDKALRATEGLDFARDLLGSVRDYYLSKIANDQNEVMKRLTMVASLLLVPTFIVGLYGMNFRHIPEITRFGSWGYPGLAPIIVSHARAALVLPPPEVALALLSSSAVLHLPELQGTLGRHRPRRGAQQRPRLLPFVRVRLPVRADGRLLPGPEARVRDLRPARGACSPADAASSSSLVLRSAT